MGLHDRTAPTVEEYLQYRERFSNWDRWGKGDELGTLNHITPEVRAHALMLASAGRTVSCAYQIATRPGPLNPEPAQQSWRVGAAGATEYIGLSYHGETNTHLDALCHIFAMPEGLMYNGRPGSDVNSMSGARSNSVERFRDGIVTRGVLYDIPRFRETEYVSLEEPVHGWELLDVARARNVEPRAGDAVLIRGGRDAFYAAHPEARPPETPGVHASTLEFLFEYDAALLAWDLMEATGQGYPGGIPEGRGRMMSAPVHEVGIPHMGLPLVDNANLEQLADACAELGRSEFLFIVAPLILRGGTGSPVNPIAVL